MVGGSNNQHNMLTARIAGQPCSSARTASAKQPAKADQQRISTTQPDARKVSTKKRTQPETDAEEPTAGLHEHTAIEHPPAPGAEARKAQQHIKGIIRKRTLHDASGEEATAGPHVQTAVEEQDAAGAGSRKSARPRKPSRLAMEAGLSSAAPGIEKLAMSSDDDAARSDSMDQSYDEEVSHAYYLQWHCFQALNLQSCMLVQAAS